MYYTPDQVDLCTSHAPTAASLGCFSDASLTGCPGSLHNAAPLTPPIHKRSDQHIWKGPLLDEPRRIRFFFNRN
jgi:hypothetical protein